MINYNIKNGIAHLVMNRPERRNAIGTESVQTIMQLLPQLNDCNAVVLSGKGPSFCAGSDLKELGALDLTGMGAHEAATATMARQLGLIATPVVAAVEGHALGGGFILAASCDLVVTSETATWSLPEVPNGWLPPWGLKALSARVGPVTARRLTWGFEKLDGHEALRLGVADYCVGEGQALARATELAAQLAALPRPAVRSTKLFFQDPIMNEAEVWDATAGSVFLQNCKEPDAAATLARFELKIGEKQ